MDLEVGDFYVVDYNIAGELFHERLVTGVAVDRSRAAVLTPDGDHYIEPCTVASDDIAEVRRLDGQGGTPSRWGRKAYYRFWQLPTKAEFEALVVEAAALLFLAVPEPSRFAPKLAVGNCVGGVAGLAWAVGAPRAAPVDAVVPAGLPGGAPGLPAPAAAAGGDDGLAALRDALGAGLPRIGGERARDDDGYVTPGRPTRDARVLPLRNDEAGQRHREFRAVVPLLSEDDCADWPVRGPRTARWCARHMLEHAGSPIAWHTKWVHEAKLQPDHPSAVSHETACRLLQVLGCYDQVDISNSAGAEIIARQIQLLEEKHRDCGGGGGKGGDSSGASMDSHLYMGSSSSRGGLCVCPLLSDWIADELRRESAVMKERRKAREERSANRPPKKGGKDGDG